MGKTVQVEKNMSPQAKHQWDIKGTAAAKLPPTIAKFKTSDLGS